MDYTNGEQWLTSSSASEKKLLEKLDRFTQELRAGVREDSVIATVALAEGPSLGDLGDAEIWGLLCHELEDFGVNEDAISSHNGYIKNWFRRATEDRARKEQERQQTEVNGDVPSYDEAISSPNLRPAPSPGGFGGSASASSPGGFLLPPSINAPFTPVSPNSSYSELNPKRISGSSYAPSFSASQTSFGVVSSTGEAGPSDPPAYEPSVGKARIETGKTKKGALSKMFSRQSRKLVRALVTDDLAEVQGIVEEDILDLTEPFDDTKDTYLIRAIQHRAFKCAEFLIPYSNLNQKNLNGKTALIHACTRNMPITFIQNLLLNGADINLTSHSASALSAAIEQSNAELIKVLLNYNADPNKFYDSHRRLAPLHLSVTKFFTTSLLTAFLSVGADIHIQDSLGNTPLHLAAGSGFAEIVIELLAQGADANMQNKAGFTPLHCAVQGTEAFRFSNSIFADRRIKVNWEPVLEALIAGGARVDAVDHDGNSPLHWAGLLWRSEAVKTLGGAGARVTLINLKGKTPLQLTGGVPDQNRKVLLAREAGNKAGTKLMFTHGLNRLQNQNSHVQNCQWVMCPNCNMRVSVSVSQ